MKTYLSILLLVFSLTCCNKGEIIGIQFDDNGVIISLPYQWKKSLHSSNTYHSNGYIKFPIIYNENIIIPTTGKDGTQYLSMVNSNTGKIEWQWNDIFTESSGGDMELYSLFKNNNLLTWQVGGRSYCINLDNGTTQWKFLRNNTFNSNLSGIDNTYFTRGNTDHFPGYYIDIGFKGNLLIGEIEEFLIPNFSFNHSIAGRCCDVTEMVPYTINSVQHLVVVYQELTSSEIWNFQSFLGLFNLETNEWVYDHKIMNEPNLNGVSLASPVIYDNKFYANIGHELVCHNITTGEQIWSKQFTQDFMFSGFIIEEGKIIANNENLTLYCLDPETGNEIWTGEGAGTSSRMSYLNGIVYFVGGSDGKFHAVDISTGKTVWRLNAEIIEDYDGLFRPYAVYVFSGENGNKGKIIALTDMYAYCFEAYR
ncbi:MAG: PQQ-like beta-propeller repeat protein [Bacteroidales bacterium]|nr:PQQ-like beta-propeller repeat protein [Bacteroidales bacterium]